MKKYLSFIIAIFLANATFAQDTLVNFKVPPIGTVWLKGKLYIDQFPVTNADYAEFLYTSADYYSPETRKEIETISPYNLKYKKFFAKLYEIGPSESYIKLIEQDYFKSLSWTNDSVKKFDYYDAEKYAYYPAINVSHQQATEYCKWRADMMKLAYAMNTKNRKQRNIFYTNFSFRLPSESEWKYAYEDFLMNKEPFTKSLFDNNIDFFNYVPGNISEMLLEKGKAIGLSWNDKIEPFDVLPIKSYTNPSDWLGFRCICEITEE